MHSCNEKGFPIVVKMRSSTPMEKIPKVSKFIAIDFETADRGPDSACALGLVRVENGRITRRESRLIQPPRQEFEFSWIHGITWDDVKGKPVFGETWTELGGMMDGVECFAAHNATFDQSVLTACCRAAGLEPPTLTFACTMQIARSVWRIYPTKLSNVCVQLGIPLNHHDALSDAEACAQIMLAAGKVRGDSVPHQRSKTGLGAISRTRATP